MDENQEGEVRVVDESDRAIQHSALVLLATSIVGFLSGLLLPTWLVAPVDEPVMAIGVCALLAVQLVATVCVAASRSVLLRGVAVVVIDLLVAFVLFVATWFLIGPSALAAVWLGIAAFLLLPRSARVRRIAMVASGTASGLSLVASTGLLTHLGAPAIGTAYVLNTLGLLVLVGASVRAATEGRAGVSPVG